MPNWCENSITITGPTEDIEKFKIQAKRSEGEISSPSYFSTDFSLNNFLPTPKKLLEKDTTNNVETLIKAPNNPKNDDWYSWRVRNWGTKWDWEMKITDEIEKGDKTALVMLGVSAWGPPIEGMQAIAHMFPTLTFSLSFDEPGMCFHGELNIKGSEILDYWNEDYENQIEYEN